MTESLNQRQEEDKPFFPLQFFHSTLFVFSHGRREKMVFHEKISIFLRLGVTALMSSENVYS